MKNIRRISSQKPATVAGKLSKMSQLKDALLDAIKQAAGMSKEEAQAALQALDRGK